MANLLKKVVVLSLLLLAVFAVYMAKNGELREEVLIKLGLAASKDFRIPEDIKIDMSDIDIEGLAEESSEEKIAEFPETPEVIEASEEGIGATSEEAWEDEPAEQKMSLEEVAEQVEEIAKQVDKIEKEVEILIAMKKIQNELNDLASEAEGLDIECPECNILSSI